MLATDYAKALFELKPNKASHLQGLRAALERRGHLKLLPQVFAEYKKLQLAEARRAHAAAVTPEAERTRVLFELYKKLIATH